MQFVIANQVEGFVLHDHYNNYFYYERDTSTFCTAYKKGKNRMESQYKDQYGYNEHYYPEYPSGASGVAITHRVAAYVARHMGFSNVTLSTVTRFAMQKRYHFSHDQAFFALQLLDALNSTRVRPKSVMQKAQYSPLSVLPFLH